MKSIFYLAVALLSVITIVNGHANHDGHDHYIEQVHEHYIRAEDPVKVTPGEIVDVNLARRGTISKRDLFTSCATALTACKQHVTAIYRNTPQYGAEIRKCEQEYNTCLANTIQDREAYPINGQAGRVCAICQEDIQPTDVIFTSRCNSQHTFHSHCIQDYVRRGHKKCPLCHRRRNLS